jgi:lysophospholipase L1-like esterase
MRTFRSARTPVVLVVSLLVALLGLVVPGASAHGSPGHHRHGHVHARGGYLALGDSVPFGFRPAGATPTPDYLDARSFVGYPSYVAHRLRLRLSNATCPGETTASLMTPGAQSNGCENSVGSPVGYRTAYPLHVDYRGTQLDYALHYLRTHHRTRLVTIMVGANDLFICQQTTSDQCTGSDFAATVTQVGSNLGDILGALRRHYHHRLVVVDYSLDYGDAAGTAAITALDGALAAAAAAHHAVVADGFGAFQKAAAAYGGDSCAAGLLVPLADGSCDVHPTAKGHHVLARAVLRAVHHGQHHR